MLVAIYVIVGAFPVWAARDPVKALSPANFVMVSGAMHATAMAFDTSHIPGPSQHLALRGDVASITLALTHPRRFCSCGNEHEHPESCTLGPIRGGVAGAGRVDHDPRLVAFGAAWRIPHHKFARSTALYPSYFGGACPRPK